MEDMFSRFIVSEEDIARQQLEEDLQLYGSRPKPPDAVDNGESIQLENRIPKRNASVFEATVDRPAKLSKREHSITFDDGAVTAMDWNSGASPLDAWLNQSAIPSTATALELPDQRDTVDDLVAQEVEEIKFFRSVHLPTASNPEEKEIAVKGCEDLELATQIYYRNIRDWYPLLPGYLARRLAQANYQRFERFRSEWLTSGQPVKQAAVQPHPVSNAFSCTGGPASSLTQMASDVSAKSNVVESTYQVVNLDGEVPMTALDTENAPIQAPVDARVSSKSADEKRKSNATASHRFRQRRKNQEREIAQKIQRLKHQVNILREMKNTRKVEDYLCIRSGNTKAQASFVVEEVVGSSPPLLPPGFQGSTQSLSVIDAAPHASESPKYATASASFRARRRNKERHNAQTIKCLNKQIYEYHVDMKDYEWCQGHTIVGAAQLIVKSTGRLVDELMALKFAEAANAPTSPAPSSQIRPIPAFSFATKSPQPVSDDQILAMDNVWNAAILTHGPTFPSPGRMVAQSPVAFDAPLSPPRRMPRSRYDNAVMVCEECKMIRRASNGDGKGQCCQCMKRDAQVSRHCNYAAK